MTKGFDDLTLTFYTMTKTIGDTKVKHVSLLILKINFLTLFGCGVKIHKINPIFGYRVKITQDIYPTYGLIVLMTPKKQLYVDLVLLVISLLTPLMSVGFKIPLTSTKYVIGWVDLVLRFLTIDNTCVFV